MFKTLRTMFISALVAAPIAIASPVTSLAQSNDLNVVQVSADWSPYMVPATVNALQASGANIQIIDIRAEKYVKRGTVPGAVWLPFSQWRTSDDRNNQPLPAADMAAMLGNAGIRLDQPIVVHNHSGKTMQNGRAAIVYWILKSAGASDLAIMNGGFKAWRAEGYPEAITPMTLPPVSIDVAYNHEWWADPIDIFAVTSGQADGAILDARLDSQVRKSVETGEPMMSMPMAQYMPASFFMRYLSASNLSAPARAEFRSELEGRGISLGEGILISVCQTGELSALSWFYASEIVGIENVRYYPDALRGWEGDGGMMFGMRASL